MKAKESWSYLSLGPTDEVGIRLASRRCCWCEMRRSGYQGKGLWEAYIMFFLLAEIYTQVTGESSHRKSLGYS